MKYQQYQGHLILYRKWAMFFEEEKKPNIEMSMMASIFMKYLLLIEHEKSSISRPLAVVQKVSKINI
jgi:hypothetical protein